MALQYSTAVRNARLDAVEGTIGGSAILEIRSGTPPANCGAGDTGTLLASCSLPSDWMSPASEGMKSMSGAWEDNSANNAGTAGHFRIKDSTGTTCHIQGTITAAGGEGDMTLDNVSFAAGQTFSVTSFTLTAGNA